MKLDSRNSNQSSPFNIRDIIELILTVNIPGLNILFTDLGISMTDIRKQDNQGNLVEKDDIITIYRWERKKGDFTNQFNYINFQKWYDNTLNSLDIQFKDENLFNELLNQVSSDKDFKRKYPKVIHRNERKISRFNNLKNGLDITFIISPMFLFEIYDETKVFGVFIIHNRHKEIVKTH